MELEIKVLWCKGLTSFNFFQKLLIYTNVSIKCDDQRVELTQLEKQQQNTPVDEHGDGNPEWNHTLTFDLRRLQPVSSSFDNLSVLFEFRHQGQYFGDKNIGEVCVPLRSLVDSVGNDVVRFVSYEVRSPEGKHNGVLDFSYKIVRNVADDHSYVRPETHISGYNVDHNSNVYGHVVHHHHQHYHHLEQHSISNDSGKIEYPRIDLEEWSSASSSSTLVSGNVYDTVGHQWGSRPPPAVYPPPQQHQWGTPPLQPSFYPPTASPPRPPVVYPPPRYGDPHWGYNRPPNNNQPNGGYPHW